MSCAILAISIRLHDGRYHGEGDWPPSPARLFQALVAGAGLAGPLEACHVEALTWLEKCESPVIACPQMVNGGKVSTFVPNNDLDIKGGDLSRIAEIRTAEKITRPRIFNGRIPFIYAWPFVKDEQGDRRARVVCDLAERLYQFGRGVDMAWAWGQIIDNESFETILAEYSGGIYRPSGGGRGKKLACPKPRSLDSLRIRYAANSQRFKVLKKNETVFSQPPKPLFADIAYESPPRRFIYELRERTSNSFRAWPLVGASKLVVRLRNGAVERLKKALPGLDSEIERVLVGRKANGADAGPLSARVKIIPLPSIGHTHADRGIRRVLIEVPAGCPLRADDVHWAFSGVGIDYETGEVMDFILTPSKDEAMLGHYGITDGSGARVWRTVTPVATPNLATRHRPKSKQARDNGRNGKERAEDIVYTAAEVNQALRHAGILTQSEVIRVQREPFETGGQRAEAFGAGTRFGKAGLWHVEIEFDAPVTGPLVIGNGRFLGLGVMAPSQPLKGVYGFQVDDGLSVAPQPVEIAGALRRAVIARVQDVMGDWVSLPPFFTGHEKDGLPAQTEKNPHLTFVFDPKTKRLLIVAPHVLDRRVSRGESYLRNLRNLEAALAHFRELRAGSSGRLVLRPVTVDRDTDPLFAPSRIWESVTPYQVTRHTKKIGAVEALIADLRTECRRRGLPEPQVTIREAHGLPGTGLIGHARLIFAVAVAGPIVLGKSRHLGGGLFAGVACYMESPSPSRKGHED